MDSKRCRLKRGEINPFLKEILGPTLGKRVKIKLKTPYLFLSPGDGPPGFFRLRGKNPGSPEAVLGFGPPFLKLLPSPKKAVVWGREFEGPPFKGGLF